MSFPKILIIVSIVLFGSIFLAAIFKDKKNEQSKEMIREVNVVELELDLDTGSVVVAEEKNDAVKKKEEKKIARNDVALPDADRISEFFNKGMPQLPIVKTITYSSHVSWIKGRPAWIADYARHYKTSRFFISRSLTGKENYFSQVSNCRHAMK